MSHTADVRETRDDGLRRWWPTCSCGWQGDPWHGPMGEPIAWVKAGDHVAEVAS